MQGWQVGRGAVTFNERDDLWSKFLKGSVRPKLYSYSKLTRILSYSTALWRKLGIISHNNFWERSWQVRTCTPHPAPSKYSKVYMPLSQLISFDLYFSMIDQSGDKVLQDVWHKSWCKMPAVKGPLRKISESGTLYDPRFVMLLNCHFSFLP